MDGRGHINVAGNTLPEGVSSRAHNGSKMETGAKAARHFPLSIAPSDRRQVTADGVWPKARRANQQQLVEGCGLNPSRGRGVLSIIPDTSAEPVPRRGCDGSHGRPRQRSCAPGHTNMAESRRRVGTRVRPCGNTVSLCDGASERLIRHMTAAERGWWTMDDEWK